MFIFGVVLTVISKLSEEDEFLIRVTQENNEHLADQWVQQFGAAPNDEELNDLIAEWVVEEAMVREARRMGLDENDTIIRRRLRQKLEFLVSDQDLPEPISEDSLESFFESRSDLYATPPKVDFIHVFFSGEKRVNPRQDAERALESIGEDDWESYGDPFVLSRSFSGVTVIDVRRDFGYRFETSLLNAPTNEWIGPVTSWYGIHLIHLKDRSASEPAVFEEVREEVLRDFKLQRNDDAKQKHVEEIASKYRVEIDL